MKINGLARALVAALLVTAGASAHAYTNNVQSCTVSGGGACETGWVTVARGQDSCLLVNHQLPLLRSVVHPQWKTRSREERWVVLRGA